MIQYLTLKSRERTELIDITAMVQGLVAASMVGSGGCDVFVMQPRQGSR